MDDGFSIDCFCQRTVPSGLDFVSGIVEYGHKLTNGVVLESRIEYSPLSVGWYSHVSLPSSLFFDGHTSYDHFLQPRISPYQSEMLIIRFPPG